MSHFEIGEWVDFVRGLTPAGIGAVMERHLASGCSKCGETARVLSGVAAVSREDAEYQVPFHLIHNARAIYALQQPGMSDSFARIVNRLIYDSFRDASPVGVRSRNRITRHALYHAEKYSLDLRLEHRRGAARVTLVGQVANRDEPGKPLAGVPVFLMVGRKITGRAIGNEFGEFQVEYQPKQRLQLCVQPDTEARRRIVVSLSRFAPIDAVQFRKTPGTSKKSGGVSNRSRK